MKDKVPVTTLDHDQRRKIVELVQEQNPRVSPSDIVELSDHRLVEQMITELTNAITAVEMLEEERSKR